MTTAHAILAGFMAASLQGGVAAVDHRHEAAAHQPATGAAQSTGGLAAALRGVFERQLDQVADSFDGVLAYAIVDLKSGARFERNGAVPMPTASVIKLAVLYELFCQADEGRVDLADTAPLDRSKAVPGGLLHELGTPSLSLRDHAVAMIVLSDNTATNVLIDRLGMDAVNARMRRLGLERIRLARTMMDLDAARRGDENVASSGDVASLLEALAEGRGLQPRSAADVLAILKKPKRTPLHAGLPPGVPTASKSGELPGVVADAGIVYVPERPYVFVVMTTFVADAQAGARAVSDLSRVAHRYFARLAESSEYGRSLR